MTSLESDPILISDTQPLVVPAVHALLAAINLRGVGESVKFNVC